MSGFEDGDRVYVSDLDRTGVYRGSAGDGQVWVLLDGDTEASAVWPDGLAPTLPLDTM